MITTEECKEGASKSRDDDVCDVVGKLHNLSTTDVSVCANCGKEDATNICNKCKMVKYCNAACKKKHRHKHKNECEEHVRLATKLHDEKLFKQPPPAEDCPICFLLLPTLNTGSIYQSCCGKVICSGCFHAPVFDNQGNKVDNEKQNECAFCRVIAPKSDEEIVKRMMKRVDAGDPKAIFSVGNHYYHGDYGFPQNIKKALELWHRAAELGYARANTNIGYSYEKGKGVEVDKKKAVHYYELAAMGGDVHARYNLGILEGETGHYERTLKHYMIAVRGGNNKSLKQIRILYTNVHATIDDDTKALRSYHAYLEEIKSVQRDKVAAVAERFRYY